MMLWFGSTFSLTGLLWWESTGHRWIPITKVQWCEALELSLLLAWKSCWKSMELTISQHWWPVVMACYWTGDKLLPEPMLMIDPVHDRLCASPSYSRKKHNTVGKHNTWTSRYAICNDILHDKFLFIDASWTHHATTPVIEWWSTCKNHVYYSYIHYLCCP